MPTLLYLHGFRSSPHSTKARLLGEAMAARGLSQHYLCPALSPDPAQAIDQIEALLATLPGPVTLLGSSLGGHYATLLAERHALPAILINPAVIEQLDLGLFIGPQTNFHTGDAFDFTPANADELLRQAAQIRPAALHPERYWLLLEEGDEVLDYRQAVEHYAGARQEVYPGGDHSFSRFAELIPAIIERAFPAG